jgi:ABC-type lipoprotein release transport system permease subunit
MTLEESSFFEHNGSQEIGILKGVDEHYNLVNDFDSSLIQGELKLMDSSIVFGVLGSTMNNKLSVNPYELFSPITAYMPSKKSTGIPGKEFKSMTIYPSGIFSVGNEVDAQYVLIGLRYMNDLMGMKNQCSAIEIKLNDKTKEKAVMSALSNLLGPKFTVKNKAMQDDGFFKIMNIEKWVSYLIACLTMLIIAFNSCRLCSFTTCSGGRPAHQFQLLHHLNVRVRHASEAICEGGTVLLACPGSRVDVSLCPRVVSPGYRRPLGK